MHNFLKKCLKMLKWSLFTSLILITKLRPKEFLTHLKTLSVFSRNGWTSRDLEIKDGNFALFNLIQIVHRTVS